MSTDSVSHKLAQYQIAAFMTGHSHEKKATSSLITASTENNVEPNATDKWLKALRSFDSSSLVKQMVDEVAHVPYKQRREFGKGD